MLFPKRSCSPSAFRAAIAAFVQIVSRRQGRIKTREPNLEPAIAVQRTGSTSHDGKSDGLCLDALYNRAFDQGLLAVMPDFRIGWICRERMPSLPLTWPVAATTSSTAFGSSSICLHPPLTGQVLTC